MHMAAVTTAYFYTQENALYQTTCLMLITVEPRIVVGSLNLLFLTSIVTLVSRGNGWS